MTKPTTQQIKEIVAKAAAGSKKLDIKGYMSSEGTVSDMVVELLPEGGYQGLIKQTLMEIATGSIKTAAPVDFEDKEAWKLGVDEQITSWNKSVAGEHAERATGVPLEAGKGFFTRADKPEVVILKSLRGISSKVSAASPNPPTKSAPKTIAKKMFAKRCPIDAFIGQLNLSPDKIESISNL